ELDQHVELGDRLPGLERDARDAIAVRIAQPVQAMLRLDQQLIALDPRARVIGRPQPRLIGIGKLRAAEFPRWALIESLKRRVEPADAVKSRSQGDLRHGHGRLDNQLLREENAARLSKSDRRGPKMLPEEAPKLTLANAQPL